MDVEQWWNNSEGGKMKDPEETLLSTTCSTTYSKSTRVVLSWLSQEELVAWRWRDYEEQVQLLSSAGHLKGISIDGARCCYCKEH